jgi:hypothetical protein
VQLSEDLNADLNLTVHVIVTWVVLTLGLAVTPLFKAAYLDLLTDRTSFGSLLPGFLERALPF